MKFSIIIPTINQTNIVLECVTSIIKNEPKEDYEIIIVDDGSKKEVTQWLEDKIPKKENIRILYSEANKGFASSVNTGIRKSIGDYILLVNNDILFIKPILNLFEKTMIDMPTVGVIGAKLIYPNGKIVQHAGVVRIPSEKIFVHVNKGMHKDAPEVNISKYYTSVTGAMYCLRRKTWEEVGDWNENYFIACEDTEYSIRSWVKGWKVFYNHEIEAIHAEGYTRGNTPQTKKIKGRYWMHKEMETNYKFYKDLDKYDLNSLDAIPLLYNNILYSPSKRIRTEGPSKTLIKRNGALGDVVLTTPIIRKMREIKGPEAIIDVSTTCGIVYDNNPHINEVKPLSTPLNDYDKVIDLDLCYENDPNKHIIDAYSLKAFGNDEDFDKKTELFVKDSEKTYVDKALEASGIDLNKTIVVHMAVTWSNRTWPKDKWETTLMKLTEKGYQIIVVGARSDFTFNHFGVFNYNNMLSIHHIKYLISKCKYFIGNDSSLIHVAGTTDTKIIGLFTCAKGEYRVPYRNGKYGYNCEIIKPNISCYGCLANAPKGSTFAGCNKNNKCLDLITPEMVIECFNK